LGAVLAYVAERRLVYRVLTQSALAAGRAIPRATGLAATKRREAWVFSLGAGYCREKLWPTQADIC